LAGRIAEKNLIFISISAAIWVYSGAFVLLGALMGGDIFLREMVDRARALNMAGWQLLNF
jgi:hypothetical protein